MLNPNLPWAWRDWLSSSAVRHWAKGKVRNRNREAAFGSQSREFAEHVVTRPGVAQIAQRANLTERSFYRWFTDKREVLFGGGQELEAQLVSAIDAVPAGTAPLPTLLAAFATAPSVFRPREFLVRRAAVIAVNPPLHERELIKLVALSDALSNALLRRGCDQDTARLATDLGWPCCA